MSTLAVVEEVLRETAVPMSVREIVERAGPRLPSKSKTPDTVVARDLSKDIKKKGEASLFSRTSPGRYTLRALAPSVAPALVTQVTGTATGTDVAPIAAAARPVPMPTNIQPAMAARKPAVSAPSSPSTGVTAAVRSGNVEGGGYAG